MANRNANVAILALLDNPTTGDTIRAAHLTATNAAICGDGTTGGELSSQQRRDIYWRVLARELKLAKAKAAEKAEEAKA